MAAKNFKSAQYSEFNKALTEVISHFRDTSVRDGNQSLDANRWRIDQVVAVLKEFDKFAVLVKEYSHKPIKIYAETIGGGFFGQNARFLGEDPLNNMKLIAAAAPNVIHQDLDRSRQLYAMVPNSEETQRVIRKEMVELGLGSKRIFDMMNDMNNQGLAIQMNIDIKNKQREAGVPEDQLLNIEGAISYIGPNKNGERVISPERYGQMAVDIIKAGADCVVVKDYAGQANDIQESMLITNAIHAALKTAHEKGEIKFMPKLNWHSHGNKPEVLKALLDSGKINLVDTGIGELSGGSAHTNMRTLMKLMMQDRGFDIDDKKYANHPVLKQFAEVENTIGEIAKVHKKFRVGNVVSDQEIYDSKVAGGAVAALWSLINKDWNKLSPLIPNLPGTEMERKTYLLKETLKTNHDVWDEAGQFNTVTPGATISYDKALKDTYTKIGKGTKTHILDHTQQYKDIVKGRWGAHIAIDEGLFDDKGLRNAYLASDSIKILKDAADSNKDLKPVYESFMKEIGLDPAGFNRMNQGLEAQLRKLDIAKVTKAVDAIQGKLPKETYQHMKYELSTAPYPAVKEGMEFAIRRVEELCERNDVSLNDSDKQHWAKIILACRTNDRKFAVGENLFTHIVVNKGVGRVGEVEQERFGDMEDLLKGTKVYDELTKFKARSADVKEYLIEHGYGNGKKPSVVYNEERLNRFIKDRLYAFAEKDIVNNLVKYGLKMGADQIADMGRFQLLSRAGQEKLSHAMKDPVKHVWYGIKKAVSEYSDNIMRILVKPENEKFIQDKLEANKASIVGKISDKLSQNKNLGENISHNGGNGSKLPKGKFTEAATDQKNTFGNNGLGGSGL